MTTHTYHDAILHYRDNGKTDAPALLLLHGGLGTAADDFAPLLPHLHPHYRVIENDTRGHGQSTRGSVPLTYAQIAADAKHLIDTLRLNTYHILGFSDGGTAAYHLALNDERAQSVLTIGAHWHSSQIEPARDMYENLTPDFLREHMPAQVAAYEQQNPQPDLATLTTDLRRLWLDNSATGYPNERVAAIKQPILAVRGEDDFLLSLPDWAALREQNPAAHLLHIPFAGHEAIKAQPDILWAAIQTFHKQQDPSREKT